MMADDVHESALWVSYKYAAQEMWDTLEAHPDKKKCDWVVSDRDQTPFLRQIEVAVLEQIKIIGKKFLKEDPPANWDFMVYLNMIGRGPDCEKSHRSKDHRWSFIQLSFFYNFKRWSIADREAGIAKAIKDLEIGKIGLRV
jgi:hypothetical protein